MVDDVVRTQIRLPKELHAQLAKYRDAFDIPMNTLMVNFIADSISTVEKKSSHQEKRELLWEINSRISELSASDLSVVLGVVSHLSSIRRVFGDDDLI